MTRSIAACCEEFSVRGVSRRSLLLGGTSFAAWAYLPKFARAADGRDPRLVVVILRGALDGLATVAPVGDPDYAGLHGSIALAPDGPHAAPTVGWAPVALPQADDDTAMRLIELYNHRDPALASALTQGLQLEKSAQGDDMKPKPGTNNAGAMRLVARGAAKLMAADDGPRIAALAFDGWDTHANEGGPVGRIAQLLSGLDGALAEFEQGLGERWRDTVIVVATEFGRTAHINGTEGTDHGTGTVALLAGGAIKGGRVISDWPGLKPANLYQARDLAPTTDLRAALKGVLHDHLGLGERVLADNVFPDSAAAKPMKGLVG